MPEKARVLELVERIYRAATEPAEWNFFAKELSEAFGGAAIAMGMHLPGTDRSPDHHYSVHLDPTYRSLFEKHILKGLPWDSLFDDAFKGCFASASEFQPDEELANDDYYFEYMKPQGLACEQPVCHVICSDEARPIAGIVVYRREGCRPFTQEDIDLGNLLVPHLERAYSIHCKLGAIRHERLALGEVVDRLPMGVILVDNHGLPVVTNRFAKRILALEDGIKLGREGLRAADARENATLRTLISTVVAAGARNETIETGVMSISRPSERRAYPVAIAPLLALPESEEGEAVAVVFIADPEVSAVSQTAVLQNLYSLTGAEADLVRLLSDGLSLEEVARERGVTMNTVRSQLKQVFAKMDTKRQGDLVRLVLTGVAAIGVERSES